MAQEEIIFPNNIRNIRAAKGMKMTELAKRANLSLSAVSKTVVECLHNIGMQII